MKLQVVYNPSTHIIRVMANGGAVPAGFTKATATFDHPETDQLGPVVNHVIFHHVRDVLYPHKIWDFGMWSIEMDPALIPVPVAAIEVTPAAFSKVVGATQQLTTTFTPANATNKNLTYTSSDVTKATVNATGLVTAIAAGTATITVVSQDGLWKDKAVATVTAA